MVQIQFDTEEQFTFCGGWEDVTLKNFISIRLLEEQKEKSNLKKTLKIIAALSNNPQIAEQKLSAMDYFDFIELCGHFDWLTKNDVLEYAKDDSGEFIECDGKKFKFKQNFNKLSNSDMFNFELLRENNPNLDPYELAFGVLLREVDENGNEKPFEMETFEFIINKLASKVPLINIIKYINFFLHGAQTSTTPNLKGFSITKK